MSTRVRLAALAAAIALVVGCSDDGDGPASSTTTTALGTTTEATDASTTDTSARGDALQVQVFFLDTDAFNIGRPPYVVPVERPVSADAPERDALDALFAGPTADETAAGLVFVASGATGIGDLRIEDGTAHVHLAGGCSSGGSTFTIADEIVATMRQFPEVVAVRIYDPEGRTGASGPGDSIPECLEP